MVYRCTRHTGYRRSGRGGSQCRGKVLVFSFLWALILLWSPTSSSNIIKDDNNSGNSSNDKLATTNGTVTHAEREVQIDGLPMGAQLLAGPLPQDDLYSNHSCSCHSLSSTIDSLSSTSSGRNSLPTCPSNNACAGRIFYLVSIHNNRTLNDALYLFRAIRDVRNVIVFHIDVKFGMESYYNSPLHKEIEACPCGSRVEVSSVHDCKWGSWSMNLPTLWSMEKAVTEYAGKFDVYINLSGDTLPVYIQSRIARLFGGPLRGINFITSSACETGLVPTSLMDFPKKWHKRSHYSHQPATQFEYVDDEGVIHHDIEVDIYFGSQCMSLTPEYCEFIVRQLARPDSLSSRFRDWLIETGKLMSDETFFTSILMRYFPETIPKIDEDMFLETDSEDDDDVSMYAIRYERMDEHVPSSNGYFPTEQRYEVPDSTGVEKPRPWGPYFLGYVLFLIFIFCALCLRIWSLISASFDIYILTRKKRRENTTSSLTYFLFFSTTMNLARMI